MAEPTLWPDADTVWPLFDPYAPARPAFHTPSGPVDQGTILARAEALARHLPAATHVANYCDSRIDFTVALLAAWLRGQTAVFPADQTAHGLDMLRQRFDGLYALAERDCPLDLPAPVFVDAVAAEGAPPAAPPRLSGDHLAVRVFTSGSTGAPKMNDKTWAMLAAGGKTIPAMLTLDRLDGANVVATVPSQHMYGFETTAMYVLQDGAAVHDGRPMYPADVARALADMPAPRVLVTTPTHLRALVESAVRLPDLDHVISATAPLGAELAGAAEARLDAPVREIYGFTEAGSVAGRRTLEGDVWRMRADYRAREAAGGPDGQQPDDRESDAPLQVVHAPALGRDVPFPDVVEVLDSGRIRLVGRARDLVNVAGKRASLSGLAARLLEIEGVQDGVFVQPGTDDGGGRVGRLLVFAVAPGLDRETLRAELRRRLEPAFVPRRIVLVDELPRNATGKLRQADLDALVQRHVGRRDPGSRDGTA